MKKKKMDMHKKLTTTDTPKIDTTSETEESVSLNSIHSSTLTEKVMIENTTSAGYEDDDYETMTTTTMKDLKLTYPKCDRPWLISNNVCDDITNRPECGFDGGDCCNMDADRDNCWPCVCYIFDYVPSEGKSNCSESDVVGDGVCDDSANNMECSYDGGDCCFG